MADDYNPDLGTIILYADSASDFAPVSVVVVGVDAFTAASGVLVDANGTDVTSSYCTNSASFSGNTLTAATIGYAGASYIIAGDYKYFISGTYASGTKKRTWFWNVKVLPKV